jgi:glutaminyl-tRNA synthetase
MTIEAELEKSLETIKPGEQFQFERHGYFVADINDSKPKHPIFNRTVTLKDTSHK